MREGLIDREKRMQSQVCVIAGPLGFYGRTVGSLVVGGLRLDAETAQQEAAHVQDIIDVCPYYAPHAWREMNKTGASL